MKIMTIDIVYKGDVNEKLVDQIVKIVKAGHEANEAAMEEARKLE